MIKINQKDIFWMKNIEYWKFWIVIFHAVWISTTHFRYYIYQFRVWSTNFATYYVKKIIKITKIRINLSKIIFFFDRKKTFRKIFCTVVCTVKFVSFLLLKSCKIILHSYLHGKSLIFWDKDNLKFVTLLALNSCKIIPFKKCSNFLDSPLCYLPFLLWYHDVFRFYEKVSYF